ncbi:MAG: phospholipase A [Thiohalomonadales bacterium]
MYNKIKQGMFSVLVFMLVTLSLNFIIIVNKTYAAEETPEIEQCLQEKIMQADNSMTVAELRLHCQKIVTGTDAGNGTTEVTSNLEHRAQSQKAAWKNPFVISVHKPNYVLLFAKNKNTNEAPFEKQLPNEDTSLDDSELKFQISVKFPLALNLFERNDEIFFAYTNRSFWQLYKTISGPFRETNHEPEIFYSLKTKLNFFKMVNMGFVHQSNGRAGTLSRSWNRLYALFVFEKNNWVLGFKPWYRISEKIEDDNNPDIEDYMGNFEFTGVYTKGHHTFSAMVRNNLKSTDNRGAVQIDWVFPLTKYFSGYVQYFNGYGESMIDYNYDQESIGIGFALSGWL